MAKCEICEKTAIHGNKLSITRSHISKRTSRTWKPNLRSVKAEINGEVKDLRTVVSDDCELNILTFNDEAGKKTFWHTASHILAQAVKHLYPDAERGLADELLCKRES